MKTTVILATAIIGFTAIATLAYAEDEENDNQQKIAISDRVLGSNGAVMERVP